MLLDALFALIWYLPWILFPAGFVFFGVRAWRRRRTDAFGFALAGLVACLLGFAAWYPNYGRETQSELFARNGRKTVVIRLPREDFSGSLRLGATVVPRTPRTQTIEWREGSAATFLAAERDLDRTDSFEVDVRAPSGRSRMVSYGFGRDAARGVSLTVTVEP